MKLRARIWRWWIARWLDRWKPRLQRIRQRARASTLLLAGWAAVTTGVDELVGRPAIVWPLSAGLLALGLYGLRRLGITLWRGLQTLEQTRHEDLEG